jgi:hypothetical protein
MQDDELQEALEKIEETDSDGGLVVGLTDELKED